MLIALPEGDALSVAAAEGEASYGVVGMRLEFGVSRTRTGDLLGASLALCCRGKRVLSAFDPASALAHMFANNVVSVLQHDNHSHTQTAPRS